MWNLQGNCYLNLDFQTLNNIQVQNLNNIQEASN